LLGCDYNSHPSKRPEADWDRRLEACITILPPKRDYFYKIFILKRQKLNQAVIKKRGKAYACPSLYMSNPIRLVYL
jgi:hypothetical protein